MIVGDLIRDFLGRGLPVVGAVLGAGLSVRGTKPSTYRKMALYTAGGWATGWTVSELFFGIWNRMQPGLPPPPEEGELPSITPPEMAGIPDMPDAGWGYNTPRSQVQELLNRGVKKVQETAPSSSGQLVPPQPTKRRQTGSRTIAQNTFGGAYGS